MTCHTTPTPKQIHYKNLQVTTPTIRQIHKRNVKTHYSSMELLENVSQSTLKSIYQGITPWQSKFR
jgi:hypothetical protein